MKEKILAILKENEKDLEQYSYYSAAWGVSEDDYDKVADEIIKIIEVKDESKIY